LQHNCARRIDVPSREQECCVCACAFF